ncbi:PASTA domain-containing protein [Sphingobacteriales bacterium UPWRP_1]|nr:hypothetical protein BVG80_06990 [Sphingobacteriales bacterium TSM_CSM]PSJ78192.1 PASTA domain-containing protein [Sphingobacteriales bacterium UPWRP_1]
MSIKRDISWRINLVFLLLCGMGVLIFGKALKIQVMEGDFWRKQGASTTRIDTIEGDRGNIYSEDGRLLATSLPIFELRMDMRVLDDSLVGQLDTLAACLAGYFKDRSKEEYYQRFQKGLEEPVNAYLFIKGDVNYDDLPVVRNFPVLKYGKFKGGLIIETKNKREQPFGMLARRTIGYMRENAQPIGIEATYDAYLRGTQVPRSMYRVGVNTWVPLFDQFDTEPQNGKDVYTTIDVNLQDIVETSLRQALQLHGADHGCAVVMEVKTGKVKAIANLGLNEQGQYTEDFNYAIGEKGDPGSTFKIAALAALLDAGFVNDTTLVDIEGGKKKYYDQWMQDASWYPYDTITLARVIQISSNVGISKLVDQFYRKAPGEFIDALQRMGITEPTGIDVQGEPKPLVKKPEDKDWSGISLTQMSIGYEVELTPLQLLTFFNAIANDGTMMRPYLVNSIKDLNTEVLHFKPTVLKRQICKKPTARKVREIMKSVVEAGTAKSIYNPKFSMACKTGTARIAKEDQGYRPVYQASIAGFFPAEEPEYSCIVVIKSPTSGQYYGGTVAAPVFRDIVEKYYSSKTKSHKAINQTPKEEMAQVKLPPVKNGYRTDLTAIFNQLAFNQKSTAENSDWAVPEGETDTMKLFSMKVIDNLVPNVTGMGLRDAIYLLESQGLKVRFSGQGQVVDQSPLYGSRCKKGDVVSLNLN